MTAQRQPSLLEERFHPLAEAFPLLDGPPLADLTADIKANGLRHPIVEYEGQILDGRNRYRACVAANIVPKFTKYIGKDPMAFVLSTNLHRRHLNESQRGMVMARLSTLSSGRPRLDAPTKGGMRQAEAAKALAVGMRTGQRAKVVIERGVPDLVARVDRGELPVAIAAEVAQMPRSLQEQLANSSEAVLRSAVKRENRAKREANLAASTASASLTFGSKLYSVILADPPWRFEPRNRDTGLDRAADNHYPTMAVEDIARIKPPAADDCALFLWATAPMLPEALQVMSAWGFAYKSHFIWAKDRRGTGYWNRNCHELLLIGTKGHVPAPAPGEQFDSVVESAVREHSAKPFVFSEMIEEMFPSATPLEMFARDTRAGWDVWGNQVGGSK